MKISSQGLDLIKSFEGFEIVAYQDSHGLYAIGYGHTKDVQPGDICTPAQATTWLLEDLANTEAAVNANVLVPLTQNQYDALVSFAYNVGVTDFAMSTLLRMVNMQNWSAATQQFPLWDHIDGVEVPGLERRRMAEAELFEGIA